MSKICSVEGCTRKHKAKGYCAMHFARFLNWGDPLYTKMREKEVHGMCGTPEYRAWTNMKDRCYNKNNQDYHRYGGRGIFVCDKWKNSFVAFFKDMGYKPFSKAQIDREDNNKGYSKGNCRWVTNTENSHNRNDNKLSMKIAEEIRIKYAQGKGNTVTLAKEYGVNNAMIGFIVRNESWKEKEAV